MGIRCATAVVMVAICAGHAHAAVELRNVQACYGRFGPTRAKLEVAPHEELMFRFVIAGLKIAADGKTDAMMNVVLVNDAGTQVVQFSQPIRETMPFGTESCPGTASLLIGATATPGEYQLRVQIEDRLAAGSARFVRKVTVRAPEFRILNPRFFVDPARTLPGPCGGLVGQTLYFRAQLADPAHQDKRTAVTLKLRVVTLEGAEVLNSPVIVHRDATTDKKHHLFAMEAELPLGREGEFRLIITAIDEISKQESVLELPLSIHLP